MRVLLDECVDRRLGWEIVGHEVKTVPEMGWAGVKNGELLRLASADFDVLITTDRNLEHQQDISALSIGMMVLAARSNNIAALRPLVPQLLSSLSLCRPGVVVRVPKE